MCGLTELELKNALPTSLKQMVDAKLVNDLNNILSEPEMAETYRDNLLSYTHLLTKGKFKVTDYANAVKYVSFKLANLTNKDAFIKTFPGRYAAYIANGTDPKDIDSYISSYNKNKLVTLLLEQGIVPLYLVNQDVAQKALNKLVVLMNSAHSEKVQFDSANAILNHLAIPEVAKHQVSIEVKQGGVMEELHQQLAEITQKQLESIQSGAVSAGTLVGMKTVKAE